MNTPITITPLPQDEGRNAPRINLEHVLSQGQVQAMEGEFKGLIEGTIARMDVAAQEYGQDPDDAAMFERAQRSELEEQAHQVAYQSPTPCPYAVSLLPHPRLLQHTNATLTP